MTAIRDSGGIRCCRIGDILLACLVIAFVFPLMATTALALKVDRSGPVLRRRTRICRNGRWIQTLEFRTAAHHGREMTTLQRFLRCTRIDTLPQAINVLRGDLTFVGNGCPGFLT